MFNNRKRFFAKHAESLPRIIEKNSLFMGEQLSETPARGEEE